MAYRNDWIRLIRQLAQKYGVDPQAALAVASQEGLSGGVGDQGTSYGPFQLHRGGALPAGRNQAWAESPQGLDYALRQIGGVSKGLHGNQAIQAIVSRFERPADPQGEIGRAIGAYSKFGGAAQAGGPRSLSLPPQGAAAPAPDPRQSILQTLASGKDIDFVALARQAMMQRQQQTSPAVATQPLIPSRGAPRGALAEAFYDPLGSWDNGKFGGPIGGHSDHVHLSITNPQTMLAAIRYAQSHGLRVGENPYVGGVAPVHVHNSFHYRDFPGKYNGRQLGEAIDVSGSEKSMAGFYRWATSNLR